MSLETESVLDRRRLKRSISWWRGAAIIVALGAIGALAYGGSEDGFGVAPPSQIARVSVEGLITEDREQLKLLKRLADSEKVKGVIVFVNSPGGTTSGGEALYEALRAVAAKKPVVAQFGTVAASAAYIAGLATDHIVARGNSITGSVGVIMQWPEVSELLSKLGVKMNEIKSGPLKASPSPFQPMDEQTRAVTQEMIMEGQRWFLGLVSSRRQVETSIIPGLEQGRVFSGREAQMLKLVDELGGEPEAVRWLEEKRGVPKQLKIVDWKPKRPTAWGLGGGAEESLVGMVVDVARATVRGVLMDTPLAPLSLDGLVSVWQPAKN
jgi:protease-4